MYSKERGFSAIIFVIIFITAAISAIVGKNLLYLALAGEEIQNSTTDTLANTFNVTETTKIALGDNIYTITPHTDIREDIYDITEYLEFNSDMTVLTATFSTRYNNINYCVLNGDTILDYRLDPKTEFVGITMGDVDVTNPQSKSVTVNSYDYPNISDLIPYTSQYTRNRLAFNTLNGIYSLKYPQTYITSNGLSEQSDTTTLAIGLPKNFTDVVFFQSDLTHMAPVVLDNHADEVLDHLSSIPHVRLSYNETEQLLSLYTNFTSIQEGTINETLNDSGITLKVEMHESDAYDITSGTSVLNYPTQTTFNFQAFNTLPLSNWNVSSTPYTLNFKGCIPSRITLIRKGYFHTLEKTNRVNREN